MDDNKQSPCATAVMSGYVLGLWDGHDSGAALVRDGRVCLAVNEERLTRRKLEIRFPERSIAACLAHAGITPAQVAHVAVSTSDFSKTLTRLVPSLKEEYYLIRRRKKRPGPAQEIKKRAKYFLTELPGNDLTGWLTKRYVSNRLEQLGFLNPKITIIDHHRCHAAAAAFCSGFDKCAVITVDGIGDARSGSVNLLQSGRLELLSRISGRHSLGIFFEHVTNLMNMRELEDEGKVMALANFAYPIPDEKNPLLEFITVDGLSVRCRYGSLRMYAELRTLLWQYPSEQFACMAQRTLEVKLCELVRNAARVTGMRSVALSGGVFSNIKANMLIRQLPEVDSCFVFPHMGDGGLALGAAIEAAYLQYHHASYPLNNIYWGPEAPEREIADAVQKAGLAHEHIEDIAFKAAALIADGNIVFWHQGRMEYGPRALGHRSILALPGSLKIKDLLNLRLKMRVWYQPFCPSMLEADARELLEGFDGLQNRFMTMGYMVREELRDRVSGVTNVDGSCRPHIVTEDDGLFYDLLHHVKKLTGTGVVLNTSFNIHGEPLVCSPDDSLQTLRNTGNEYLIIGNYLVRNGNGA